MANILSAKKYAKHTGLPYKKVLELAKIDGFPALRIGGKKIYILPDQARVWFEEQARRPLD